MNDNNNNKTIIKLPNVILIKIINYLTSFWESSNFTNDVNELFTVVINNVVRDLSMVSKEWYCNLVPRGLKLPNYYLIEEAILEKNKTIQRMIKSESVFIKIASGTSTNYSNGKLIEKYSQSISTLSLQPSNTSNIKITYSNLLPFIFTNITKLEINLNNCTYLWGEYLENLFPIEQYNSKKSTNETLELFKKINKDQLKYIGNHDDQEEIIFKNKGYIRSNLNFEWTNKITNLIITKSAIQESETFDLSILNNFVKLGGFQNIYHLKLNSNYKEFRNMGNSELISKVTHLSLYGIKINLDEFEKLFSNQQQLQNNIKILEIVQCTTDRDKSFGINKILSKYISNGKSNLESYYHDTFENQDINSVILLLSSTESSKMKTINIKSSLQLANNDNGIDINSIKFQNCSINNLSLFLPDPQFIKFIFSKVNLNLKILNLKLNSSTVSTSNQKEYDNEIVEILLEILKNQINLIAFKIQLNQKELEAIKKNKEYPNNCNWFKIFQHLIETENSIQELDLRNIWISGETITKSLLSINSNPKSKLRYLYLTGVSNIDPQQLYNNTNFNNLFINCKLTTLGLSLSPLNCHLPIPSSFTKRYLPSFLSSTIDNNNKKNLPFFIDLLIEILNKNKSIQHIFIDEIEEKLYYLSDEKKKNLEHSIKSNKTLVSIGLPNYLSSLLSTCPNNSIYPYFNSPSLNR